MPIWFELLVLLLAAYAVGIGIGWLFWGRSLAPEPMFEATPPDAKDKDT